MKLSISEKIHIFIATGLYSGFSKIMPGTVGTLTAVPFAILLYSIFSKIFIIIFLIILTLYSFFICYDVERIFRKKDPSQIVIDEWIGFFISVFSVPISFKNYIFAFIIFRIFDILKPFPVKNLEAVPQGIGVVLDDFMAGIYTLVIVKIFIA